MGVYDYPELYATLMYPEPELLEAMLSWLDRHQDGPLDAMFDPCCGPGTWLVPFAARGFRVAGSDLSPGMVDEAKLRLAQLEPEEAPELHPGDMRALQFETAPFDFALNMHASVGHLPDRAGVVAHLKSVAEHLRPGGLYLFGIILNDGKTLEEDPEVLYESELLHVPSGGMAACHYTSMMRDQAKGEERIDVMVLTTDVSGVPERIDDSYVLKSYGVDEWRSILEEAGGFELLAAHSMADDRYRAVDLDAAHRDCTLILKRKA